MNIQQGSQEEEEKMEESDGGEFGLALAIQGGG